MEGTNILEIVLKARDEASKTISEMGDRVEETAKKTQSMSATFKEAGLIVTGAGLAGVAMMKSWIDKGMESQVVIGKTNTLLVEMAKEMSTESQAIYENTGNVKTQTKEIQEQISAKQLQIQALRLSGGEHKNEISEIQKGILALKQHSLEVKTNGVAHGELVGYTKATKVSFEELRTESEKAGERMLKLGFEADSGAMAFTRLLGPTKDVKLANEALATAADLARFQGIGLDEASVSVTRALEGNAKILKTLGIDVPKHATGLQILGLMHERLQNQAENFANSYQGLQVRFNTSITELQQRLGLALLPTFDKLFDKLDSFITWLNKLNPGVINTIAKVTLFATGFALVAGPILLIIGFLPSLAAGFAMVSAALIPVTLVLAGVALAGYLIYTHWNEITKAFQASMPFINGVIASLMQFWKQIQPQLVLVFNLINKFIIETIAAIGTWIKSNTDTFVAFWEVIKGVFNFSLGFIIGLWQTVWPALAAYLFAVWEIIKGIIQVAWGIIEIFINVAMGVFTGNWTKAWEGVKKGFSDIWNGIKSIVKGVIDGIIADVRLALDSIIGFINGIISGANMVASKIPGGKGIQIPLIPKFEMGGYVPSTGLAVVHEGEYVLSKDMIAGRQPVNIPNGGGGNRYNQPINIYATVNETIDMNLLGHKIAFALRNSR